MNFEVNIDQYSGPLQLLLEMIEKERLSITQISLAQVADDYLKYIETRTPPMEELADFLVIASRLILIKSQAILPREETIELENGTSLVTQLQLYKYFSEVAEELDKKQKQAQRSFERVAPESIKLEAFVFPQGLTQEIICQTFTRLMKQLEPFFHMRQTALERVISVKERLQQIREALMSRSKILFRDVVKNGHSKIEIVVSFLALLELIKQQSVRVVQLHPFSDIELMKRK